MLNEAMLSIQRTMLVSIKPKKTEYSISNLITIDNIIEAGLYDAEYDFNKDGIVDAADRVILRRILLGIIDPDEL